MSLNLLDTVTGLFTPGLISNTASSLGESEGGLQKALSGAIPTMLAGLLGKADSHEGAAALLDLSKQAAGSGIVDRIGEFLGNDNSSLLNNGAEMLKSVFGDKAGSIASLVANFAGIKHSSASAILSMAAPAALGALGKHAADHNLNAGGLTSFLNGQKTAIINALPSGLSSIAGLLGIGAMGNAPSTAAPGVTSTEYHTVHHAEETAEPGGLKFLMPLLLAVFAVALGIYFFNGCGGGSGEMAKVEDTVAVKHPGNAGAITPAATVTRELVKVKLPNDTIIDAYKGGIEDKLVTYLKTDYKKLGEDSLKQTWFDFDNLNFETGSANITAASQVQVNNLAAILKAFPMATLKIGGYTDKVGDEASNKKLSDARAKSVEAALAKAGAGKQITAAEGYGSAYANYAADAPESDRIKDRHVSVSVR